MGLQTDTPTTLVHPHRHTHLTTPKPAVSFTSNSLTSSQKATFLFMVSLRTFKLVSNFEMYSEYIYKSLSLVSAFHLNSLPSPPLPTHFQKWSEATHYVTNTWTGIPVCKNGGQGREGWEGERVGGWWGRDGGRGEVWVRKVLLRQVMTYTNRNLRCPTTPDDVT